MKDWLKEDISFLFETALADKENRKNYYFAHPKEVIRAEGYSQVEPAFQRIDELKDRYYLAGYFSYELGYYFEKEKFAQLPKPAGPLIYLGVFLKPSSLPKINVKGLRFTLKNIRFSLKEKDYLEKIKKIKDYIRKGDTYQVNFTGNIFFDFGGSPVSLYEYLKIAQPVPYAAFCRIGPKYILSFSPELFFRRNGHLIYSRPMKGTAPRGKDIELDRKARLRLKLDAKTKAENLMIVDLIRNDLGRICVRKTVKVSNIFSVQKYPTLFQMTSTVKGRLKKGISYSEIFSNTFPGGSVTGAPKVRTMQIIRELEINQRGIYCGALGFLHKDTAVFNMPIRTLEINQGKGHMGVGSGIVIDSDAKDEYRECLLKAKFLEEKARDFKIIETMRWQAGFTFLPQHISRLKKSAAYFGFQFDEARLKRFLKEKAREFSAGKVYRVRLLLSREGSFGFESAPFRGESPDTVRRVAVARIKTDPEDIFLFHKTTNRKIYDRFYRQYSRRGYFDVIFRNTRNEFTEGSISNIIIQQKGRLYTPPLESGLLPGIYRQHLLNQGKVKEKIMRLSDLKNAERIFLCNSLRGITEVRLG